MALRDIISGLGFASSIAPDKYTANVTGAAVDTRGFGGTLLALLIGVGGITFDGTNKIDVYLEQSNDGSTWTGVSQSDVQASFGSTVTVGTGGIIRSLTSAKAAADVQKIGYIGTARYVRARAAFGGTHGTGTGIAAVFTNGIAEKRPVG